MGKGYKGDDAHPAQVRRRHGGRPEIALAQSLRVRRRRSRLVGNTLTIWDSITGESAPAHLFVAVIPCSGYAYVEACSDMKLGNWLMCHANAYAYFGGVTRLLIPDNLKTGVTKNTRYETVLKRSYQELAEHYDTAVSFWHDHCAARL